MAKATVSFTTFLLVSLIIHVVIAGRWHLLHRKRFSKLHPSWDSFERDLSLESEIDDEGRVFKNPRNSPSPQCPRDEEQALLLGQKCLRKCSSDEDCKSKKKKCRCDGMCGMSCIKPERECDALISPELGSVSFTGRFFGDRATYTCEPGFHLVGLRERSCQADGSWSGRPPVCRQNIYCTEPPLIEHARHNALPEQLTFDLDTILQYHCTSGYVPGNGFPKTTCLAVDGVASWYGPDITCEPRSCGAPADIPQGWHAGECHTYGCRVAYHCAEGFELVGRQERYCLADGTWSPRELPSCVLVTAVQCPVPEDPPNGKAMFTSCSYNSVVSYECNYGYTLVGDTTRRCGADRKWSGVQPHCKEINCGHPGPLYNGWLENIEGGTGLGSSIIFRCHDGMTLEGNTSTVCQIDGKWRYQPPKCLAPCVVPKVYKGRVIRITKNGSEIPLETSHVVPHGDRLAVDCAPQYEFLHNNTPVICNNGTWTLIPRCDPARCKIMPKPPRNGMVIAPKTEHGMRARYKCKDGYTLKGDIMAECRFGNWTGGKAICKEVYCPFPGYVENGKVMLVGNMGVYDYRPYVRRVTNNKQIMYECNRGFTLLDGPPGATCIGGRWSPKELPRCVRGMHPRLRWSRSIREERALAASGTVKIQKKPPPPPKEREREREREREKEKEKEHALELEKQKKEEQEKEKENEKEHGRQTEREHRNRNRDKSKKGRKSRKRGGKGKGPCETLANDPVLEVEITKIGRDRNHTYSSGTIIKVSCNKGYDLNVGSNITIKCVRGRWKPAKPECLISPCHIPFSENGIYEHLSVDRVTGIILSQTTAIRSGAVVQFSCRPGYHVKGPGNLRCWHGDWSVTSMPNCTPAPCELPVIPGGQYLFGYRAGLTIANGSSVTFQCGNDRGRVSPQTVECILGDLRPRFPECHNTGNGVKEHDVVFKGGSDITKGGDIIIDLPAGFRRSCGPPARVQGSLIYRDGEPIREEERSFPDGTEIIFNCIASINEKTTWRIICEDGSWVGRSLNCDADDYGESKVTIIRNTTCTFRNSEPNVVSFFNDQQITEEVVDFPAGSVLVSRCVDIGKYAMIGSSRRRCINGAWDGQKPVCFGLNQENDYALEKPPTILFRHQVGPIAQSNDGRLIVYPSTILHMECLWIRRFGPPKWVVSHNYRKYPQGWTTDPGRDSQLEYRLSIYHANKDDSGIYTCVTPMRHSHSVEIVVEAIHCPPIPPRRGLNLSTPKTKMNTRVVFTCANGNSLIGAPEIACLPSGNWSAPVPICESIECADLINLTDTHLQVSIVSREVGGRAAFSCRQGFGLRGPAESVCLQSGDWSLPLPVCEEVQCNTPSTPDNGYIQGNGPFKAGDVVQFNCNPEYMMEGQPIIACQENGRWSGSVPKCVQACPYPGTTISGRMSAVKFYYKIGETVSFTCDEGLELRGAPMLRCLRNGKWSNAIPTCVHLSGNRNR